MIYNLKAIRKQVLGLSLSEVSFQTRGFGEVNEARQRLELVAKTVVQGYNDAVEHGAGKDLEIQSLLIRDELSGFYNEGLGMGLYALDYFSIRKKDKFWEFVNGHGHRHEYMAYIGAGLAAGVFGLPFKWFLEKADPTSGCLMLDGIGFYHAYFKTKKTISRFYIPESIANDAFYLERFDNGVGRALWFYNSGDPVKIARTISGFLEQRRAALWSGVGLAATYAGGVSTEKIKLLKRLSGEYSTLLAQGAVLATHTRQRAQNPRPSDSTERILVGKTALECHAFAMEAKAALRGRRFINGKHSFQVFLEDIRHWILTQEQSTQYDVA